MHGKTELLNALMRSHSAFFCSRRRSHICSHPFTLLHLLHQEAQLASNGGLPILRFEVSSVQGRADFNGIFLTRTIITFEEVVTAPFVVECPTFKVIPISISVSSTWSLHGNSGNLHSMTNTIVMPNSREVRNSLSAPLIAISVTVRSAS